MTTSAAIREILKSAKSHQHLETIQQALADEAKRRQDFYNWIDETAKAEFIQGKIVIHSPVKDEHWKVSDLLSSIISVYARRKKLGRIGVEKVMVSLTHNDFEPDIVFYKKEKAETFSEGQVLFPTPDFVIEILSKSTARIDRTVKKEDYAAHGVQEYWIIDPVKQVVEQYLLPVTTDTAYFLPKIYSIHDEITSAVIEGFTIPVSAIFDADSNDTALEKLLRKNN